MNNFVSYRARFQGTLAGIKVSELMGLDYSIETLEGRMKHIEEKLNKVQPFYDEYFSIRTIEIDETSKEMAYYNYSPNTTDELSADINICKYIECYANYILNSKDLPRERQQQYKILSEKAFERVLQREKALSSFSNEDNEEIGIEVENIILDTRRANDYNNLDLLIKDSDLDVSKQKNPYGVREKDIELAGVLQSYSKLYEHLKTLMKKAKAGEKTEIPLTKIIQLTSGIKRDMLDSKEMILGIRCHAKRLGDESPMNDMSEIDYTNMEHIKAILKNCPFGAIEPDNEMTDMAYDMEKALSNLYKSGKLDKTDMIIVEMYNIGFTQREIANEIGRDKKVVSRRLEKIFKSIVEYSEIGKMSEQIKKTLKK